MRTCFIHVGMHKTGSSSIQRTLVALLEDHEQFVYPPFNEVGNHSEPMFSLFTPDPENYPAHQNRDRSKSQVRNYNQRNRETLLASIVDNPEKNFVTSGEDLSRLQCDALAEMRDFFAQHFDAVRVIAYVRPPRAYISSAFQQTLKGVGRARVASMEDVYPGYRECFEKFDEVFGRDQVQLKKFDSQAFARGCVVQDFCEQVGIAITAPQVIRFNDGLSREAVAILYAFRELGQGFGVGRKAQRADRTMLRALRQLGGAKFRLAAQLTDPVLDANSGDIDWMEQRLGESLAEPALAAGREEVTDLQQLLELDMAALEEFFAAWRDVVGAKFPVDRVAALWPDAGFVAALINECAQPLLEPDRRIRHDKNRPQ